MNFVVGKYKKDHWYATVNGHWSKHLHKDGKLREGTFNHDTGKYTGFWKTKKALEDFIKLFNNIRK